MNRSRFFRVFPSIFHAYGHPAILSTHPSTLEITTTHELTRRGDCVVAVKSSGAVRNLPEDFTATTQRSEEHTSELQSRPHLVCRPLPEKKKELSQVSQ